MHNVNLSPRARAPNCRHTVLSPDQSLACKPYTHRRKSQAPAKGTKCPSSPKKTSEMCPPQSTLSMMTTPRHLAHRTPSNAWPHTDAGNRPICDAEAEPPHRATQVHSEPHLPINLPLFQASKVPLPSLQGQTVPMWTHVPTQDSRSQSPDGILD